jgi:hypothetical protein
MTFPYTDIYILYYHDYFTRMGPIVIEEERGDLSANEV